MDDELAKRITPPLPAVNHIVRKKLLKLFANIDHRFIYLFGAPGYGKTEIAAQWIATEPDNAIWMTASKLDSRTEFVMNWISAIQKVVPNFGKKILSQYRNEIDNPEHVEQLCRELGQVKKRLKFVLDDGDQVPFTFADITSTIARNLPPNVKVLMVRRKAPSIETYQVMNSVPIFVISPADLRFDKEEIALLFPDKNQNEISHIEEITEGWPAGVHILSKTGKEIPASLQPQMYKAAALQALSILDQEDKELFSKLVWLTEFSADMAVKVSEISDAPRILSRLSTDSVFISRIQDDPILYRINSLVKEAFIASTSESDNRFDIKRTLQNLLKNGFTKEALLLIMDLGNAELVNGITRNEEFRNIVFESIRTALYERDLGSIEKWHQVVKLISRRGDAGEKFFETYKAFVSSDFPKMKHSLMEFSELANESREVGSSKRDEAAFWSIYLFVTGDLQGAIERGLQAFTSEHHDALTDYNRISFLRYVASAAMLKGDTTVLNSVEALINNPEKSDSNIRDQISMHAIFAVLALNLGNLIQVNEISELIRIKSLQAEFDGVFSLFEMSFAEIISLLEDGSYEEAHVALESNFEKAKIFKVFPWAIEFGGKLAEINARSGAINRAFELILELRELIDREKLHHDMHSIVDRYELAIRVLLDDHERISKLLQRLPQTSAVTRIHINYLLRHKPAKALELLKTFEGTSPGDTVFRNLGLAQINIESPPMAKEFLNRAIDIGSSNGYYSTFLNIEPRVAQLIISLANERSTVFLERIARELGKRMNARIISDSGVKQSLTRREADILRHLSTGLPIKTIADNLNISRNTIKTHLRNLYRKLEVADRNEAVDKGRQLLKI